MLMKLEFSRRIFLRNLQNFMEIRPVGAELFRADTDGRTGMTKLIVTFHSLVNVPKKV